MTDQDIIDAAVKISDETERSHYLERASQGDTTRRRRLEAQVVQAFVGAYEKTGEAPLPSMATMTSAATPPTRPATPSPFADDGGHGATLTQGGRIGPYKLLQKLGEGGMGSVWMAEQEKPVRRTVALKAIKPGMDSDRVLARFEAERQALALMDHPNIAKVLDAGTTENGCPYFIMELVKGVPITKFCDDQKLDIKSRLELFIPICQAIQHAHQKGIIHRDIKPSNVMVALYDGRPIPKVIDFGIAKATGPKLTDKTIFTEFGSVIGTLEYMAPEQAELNALDIDTRSDVYSLGVMLYELLTGSTPLGRDTLQRAAFAEVIRRIKEEEPPRPSTRLSDSKDSLPGISAQRQTEPAKLPQSIRGDLDWIVMKALAKERDRRYETCNNFAIDLMHFLQNEPVSARPPSTVYLVQKFVRRHRTVVATAAASILLLIGATIFSTAMYAQMKTAKGVAESAQLAEAEQKKTAEKERDLAKEANAESIAVQSFFEDNVLKAVRTPTEGGLGHDATVRAAIDRAIPLVSEKFGKLPRVEARVRAILGNNLSLLGELERAEPQLERALKLYEAERGPQDDFTVKVRNNWLTCKNTRGKLDLQIKDFDEQLTKLQANPNADPRLTLAVKSNLADAYSEAGQLDRALTIFREVHDELKKRFDKDGKPDKDTLAAANNIATVLFHKGQIDSALQLFEMLAPARQQLLGPEDRDTITSVSNLASMYGRTGKLDAAMPLFEDALWLRVKVLGMEHPHTVYTMNNLGVAVEMFGGMDRDEAKKKSFKNPEPILRKCLDLMQKKSPESWMTYQTQSMLGWATAATGQDKFAAGETMMIAGYNGLKKSAEMIPADYRSRRLCDAADRLADLYKKWSKPDDEKKWRETAKSYHQKA